MVGCWRFFIMESWRLLLLRCKLFYCLRFPFKPILGEVTKKCRRLDAGPNKHLSMIEKLQHPTIGKTQHCHMKMLKTTVVNLDCAFVKNALLFLVPKIKGGDPPSPPPVQPLRMESRMRNEEKLRNKKGPNSEEREACDHRLAYLL